MANAIINADTEGLKSTGGDTAALNIQTNSVNAISIDANQNVTFDSTGAVKVPVGTDAQRPAGATGLLRFNSTSVSFEGYNGSAWSPVGGGNTTTKGLWENANSITANYTIGTNNNALSAGPVSVADGVVVTVPSGSVWTIV